MQKPGRPRKSDTERKTRDIFVRLTEAQYERVRLSAAMEGCETVSEWVRNAIDAYIGR